jgi:FtsP/CotA-like multicopper oxidase with cupredoxin domain
MRFRDWLGRYVMHCHNVIHEDHAMMLRFDVATTGDTNPNP